MADVEDVEGGVRLGFVLACGDGRWEPRVLDPAGGPVTVLARRRFLSEAAGAVWAEARDRDQRAAT